MRPAVVVSLADVIFKRPQACWAVKSRSLPQSPRVHSAAWGLHVINPATSWPSGFYGSAQLHLTAFLLMKLGYHLGMLMYMTSTEIKRC